MTTEIDAMKVLDVKDKLCYRLGYVDWERREAQRRGDKAMVECLDEIIRDFEESIEELTKLFSC